MYRFFFGEQFYIAIGTITTTLHVRLLPRFCGLLGEQDAVPLLESDPVARKFIIRRESGWMCRFCYLARGRHFLECVDSFAILIQSVHEMHGGRG